MQSTVEQLPAVIAYNLTSSPRSELHQIVGYLGSDWRNCIDIFVMRSRTSTGSFVANPKIYVSTCNMPCHISQIHSSHQPYDISHGMASDDHKVAFQRGTSNVHSVQYVPAGYCIPRIDSSLVLFNYTNAGFLTGYITPPLPHSAVMVESMWVGWV